MAMSSKYGELMEVNTDCNYLLMLYSLIAIINAIHYRDLVHMFALISEVFKRNNLELFLAVPPPLYYGYEVGALILFIN